MFFDKQINLNNLKQFFTARILILTGFILLLLCIVFFILKFFFSEKIPKIGVMLPMYGEKSFLGRSVLRGINLALKNAVIKVDIVAEDVPCGEKDVKKSFYRLLKDDVVAVIGFSCLENLTVVAGLSDLEQIIVMTPVITKKEVVDAGEYVFRTIPGVRYISREFARVIYEKGYTRLAILHPPSEEYQSIVSQMMSDYKIYGGKVVSKQAFHRHSKRIQNAILRLKSRKSDAVLLFVDDYDTAKMTLAELFRQNIAASDIFIVDGQLGRNFMSNQFAQGVRFVLPPVGNKEFSDLFHALYREENPDFYAAASYNAMVALVNALDFGHRSAKDIRRFFYERDFLGANGSFSFDNFGDIVTPVHIYEINGDNLCLSSDDLVALPKNVCINPFK